MQLIYILAHEGFSFDHSMMSRGTVLDATGYSKPFTKSFSARIDFCLFQKPATDILGVCGRLAQEKVRNVQAWFFRVVCNIKPLWIGCLAWK